MREATVSLDECEVIRVSPDCEHRDPCPGCGKRSTEWRCLEYMSKCLVLDPVRDGDDWDKAIGVYSGCEEWSAQYAAEAFDAMAGRTMGNRVLFVRMLEGSQAGKTFRVRVEYTGGKSLTYFARSLGNVMNRQEGINK